MSTDLELLKLAAKAMHNQRHPDFCNYEVFDDCVCLELGHRRGAITSYWNPLADDGDAFRLAVALGMEVYVDTHPDGCNCVEVYSVTHDTDRKHQQVVDLEDDPYAATRRAIVRAAAEIGRTMP